MTASKQNFKIKSNSVLTFASEYFENGDSDNDSIKLKDVYEDYIRHFLS